MFIQGTSGELRQYFAKLRNEANCERAAKGWKTRAARQWLRALYALEDTRECLEASRVTDSPLNFLERLYRLEVHRACGE